MIESDETLYGADSPAALTAEVFENYKNYVNPPLARVMKISGSPVEVRASGSTIWDAAGKSYLDFAGGYGVFTLGHSHPRVVAAVRAQLELMSLSGKTMFNVLLGRAAKRLAELAPGDLQISFWCNSGTEAIEGAIKLARAATGRTKIVSTINAFHGKTMGALSVSGREAFQTPFQPLLEGFARVPYGELDGLDEALQDAAAFVVEPVQGEGGVNVPPDGYLRAVRDACDRSGALFVADEVQTGFGRCGYRFGVDREGVVPDVMTLAKGLSGGVIPVGAFISRPDIWNRAFGKAPLVHTSTFGGSELACAAALAAMDVLEEDRLVDNARERGAQLAAGARTIAAEFPGGYPRGSRARAIGRRRINQRRLRRLDHPRNAQIRRHRSVDPEFAARHPSGTAPDRDRGRGRSGAGGLADRGRDGLREARPLISDAIR